MILLCLILFVLIGIFYAAIPEEAFETIPSFDEILIESKIDKYLDRLIKMGIVDTRLLFRLSKIDYQMMTYLYQIMFYKSQLRKDLNH